MYAESIKSFVFRFAELDTLYRYQFLTYIILIYAT